MLHLVIVSLESLYPKTCFFFLLSVLLVSCDTSEEKKTRHVKKVEIERELEVSVDAAWENIFLELDKAYKFSPAVEKSGFIGSAREVSVGSIIFLESSDKGLVKIRVTELDDSRHLLKFKIHESQLPIDTAMTFGQSELIRVSGEKTLLKLSLHFKTNPTFLAELVKDELGKNLKEVASGIETYLVDNREK